MTLLCSCSGNLPEMGELESYLLRNAYRNSTCIVKASCISESDKDGYSIMNITETMAGHASGVIYIAQERISLSEEYIIFIDSVRADLHYDADECTTMQIRDDSVLWEGKKYSKEAAYKLLSECEMTLSFPFTTYFYETRADLYKGSSDIIVGRAEVDPVIEERNTYTQTGAVSRTKMTKCNIVTVHVISSLCGDLKSGDSVEVVFSPESVSSMTSASTLSTVSLAVRDIANLENSNYYIFFLDKTEDVKQNIYFPVNPVQGWVELDRDNIKCAEKNTLFDDCKQIKQLISELNLGTVQEPAHNTKTDPIGE